MRKLRFAAASFCRSRFSRPNPLCTERSGTRLYERPLADGGLRAESKEGDEMMKMNRGSLFAKLASVVGVAIFAMAPALAQKPTATVHGHVTNPAGIGLHAGRSEVHDRHVGGVQGREVHCNGADRRARQLQGYGNHAGRLLRCTSSQGDKVVDRVELKVKAEDTDLTLNDDMTRPEYMKAHDAGAAEGAGRVQEEECCG